MNGGILRQKMNLGMLSASWKINNPESLRSWNIMVHLGTSISWKPPQNTGSHPCTRPPSWVTRGSFVDTSDGLFVRLILFNEHTLAFAVENADPRFAFFLYLRTSQNKQQLALPYRRRIIESVLQYWFPIRTLQTLKRWVHVTYPPNHRIEHD